MAGFNLGTAQGKISVDTSDLNSSLSAMKTVGFGLTGIGTGLVGAFGAAIGAGANFETQISTVKAVTGDSETNITRLRDAALDLGRQGPFGPTEVAGAFVELAKAGLTATEIIEGAGTATINLAKAGDIKIADAAEIAANVMRTFGIEAGNVNEVVDVLAGAANQSTLDVQDLAVSLKYVGGVAATLNTPIDQVATSLALLGNAGIKGSTGGTSLRQILLQLNPVSKNSRSELKKLGIITEDGKNKFFDAQGNVKSLAETFQVLQDATKNLSNEEKTRAFKVLFGNRAAAAALILTREGTAGFQEMGAAIGKVSAADVAAERLNNLNGSIRKFKAAMQSALIDAGSPFQKTLKGIVDGATKLLSSFDKIPRPLKTIALGGAAVLGVLSLMAGGFLLTVGPIIKMVILIGKMGPAFKIMRLAMLAATKGVWAFTASLLANPIFLIVAAIVALGVALFVLYKKNKAFRDFVDNLWQTIQKVWDAILGFFKRLPGYFVTAYNAVKSAISSAIDWIVNAWGAVVDFFKDVGNKIVDVFTGIKDKVVEISGSIWDKVSGFFKAIAEGVVTAFNSVIDFFQKLPGRVIGAVDKALEAMKNFSEKLPFYLGYAIGAAIGLSIRFAVMVYNAFISFTTKAADLIIDFFTKLPRWFADFAVWVATWVKNLAVSIYNGFIDWVTSTYTTVKNWVTTMITTAIDLGTRFIKTMGDFFSALPGVVWGWLVAAYNFMVTWVTNMVTAAVDFGVRVITAIINFFKGLPGQIWTFLVEAATRVAEWVTGLVGKAGEVGTLVIDKIIAFFKALPGKIKEAIGNVGDLLLQAGKDIIAGLLKGLKSGVGKIKDFFGGVTKGIKDWKGPMKVDKVLLTGAGTAIMDSLLNAVQAKRGEVQALFEAVTRDIGQLGSTMNPFMTSGLNPISSTISGQLASGVGAPKSDTIINIHNPEPKPAEESIAMTMRKLQYLGVNG